jgi:hypothetical protein
MILESWRHYGTYVRALFLDLCCMLLFPISDNTHVRINVYSWVTGATTIASGWSYVGGASLTASGNKIRESVQKEIATLEKQAKASGIKIKETVQKEMVTLETKAKALSNRARRNRKR